MLSSSSINFLNYVMSCFWQLAISVAKIGPILLLNFKFYLHLALLTHKLSDLDLRYRFTMGHFRAKWQGVNCDHWSNKAFQIVKLTPQM